MYNIVNEISYWSYGVVTLCSQNTLQYLNNALDLFGSIVVY